LVTDFVDANVLVYLVSDDERRLVAIEIMKRHPETGVQAVNEMINVMRRKMQTSQQDQNNASLVVRSACNHIHPLVIEDHVRALDLVTRHKFSWWDGVLIATALRAGASRFFSEDQHDGLLVDNQMTIINPFRG
jgi:predicted nucleic acid-binding protein